MKKYVSILFLSGVAVAAFAQNTNREPYMVKNLSGDAIQNVRAQTTGGNISVTSSDANARIEVYISPNNSRDRDISKEELEKRLAEYELSVTADNHKLTAIAKPKHNFNDWKKSLNISFKIYVGRNVSTDLSTSGGNIDLSGLSGTQDFTTSGGNLNVDHLSGHIKGRTSGGNIHLSDLQDDIDLGTSGGNITADNSHGKIRLSTSGGSLKLHGLEGDVNATTSGGNVHADDVAGDLEAHTSGGNVDMSNLSCSLETSTSGGNINVSLKKLGKFVKITNSGGHVDLEVPQGQGIDINLTADRVNASALNGFKGDIKKDRVAGTLNGGGIPVTVRGGSNINFTVK